MSACLSCELELPLGVKQCPACGTEQVLQAAKADEARCSLHQATQAIGTCKRCGRFMCVECSAVDAGVCRSCIDQVRREVRAQFEAATVRGGWAAVVQGLTAMALTWKGRELFWLLSAVAAFSVFFGLLTVARRELWIIGAIACGLIGFISFFALFDAPLLVLCVALAALEWRFIKQSEPLERELWRLK